MAMNMPMQSARRAEMPDGAGISRRDRSLRMGETPRMRGRQRLARKTSIFACEFATVVGNFLAGLAPGGGMPECRIASCATLPIRVFTAQRHKIRSGDHQQLVIASGSWSCRSRPGTR